MSRNTHSSYDYGPRRLSIELANICNLHCSYCFRDEDALYSSHTKFFPVALLKRLVNEARDVAGITKVIFTGGEPTLHPQFVEMLEATGAAGLTSSFVTNGWHFNRIWPAVISNRDTLTHVAFSLDGITRETHDYWRGAGSFDRLIQAFSRCFISGLPFAIKIVIRRDTVDLLEQIAIFAARMGASTLNFVHLMPTDASSEASSLGLQERRNAEEEVAVLRRIFKMNIGIDVGYYNIDKQPPCSPLAGTSMNVDYLGRLSLCCNLSGFRGAAEASDVIADLNVESFAAAYEKFQLLAAAQLKKRKEALSNFRNQGIAPDLYTGSPCLFCLQSYGKIPWHHDGEQVAQRTVRTLPTFNPTA